MTDRTDRTPPRRLGGIEAALADALAGSSYAMPTTPEQVAESEREYEEALSRGEVTPWQGPVPDFRNRPVRVPANVRPLRPDAEEELARAARFGGKISPAVEEAMWRDRERAEAEGDDV